MKSSIIPASSSSVTLQYLSKAIFAHPAQWNLYLLHSTHPPHHLLIPPNPHPTFCNSKGAEKKETKQKAIITIIIPQMIISYTIFLNHLSPSLIGFKGRSGEGVFTLAFVLPPMASRTRERWRIHNKLHLVPFFSSFVVVWWFHNNKGL